MNSRRFQMDFKHVSLTVDNDGVPLHGKSEEKVLVILTEDVSMPENCQMIMVARLDWNVRNGDTTGVDLVRIWRKLSLGMIINAASMCQPSFT